MYSQKMVKQVKDFLDLCKVSYRFDEEKGVLTYDFGLGNKIELAFMKVYFFEDCLLNRTRLFSHSFPHETDRKREVIEFLTRANDGFHDGNFEIDLSERFYDIWFKQVSYCDTDVLTTEELVQALFYPLYIVSFYGDALLDVMNGNDTPKHALEEAEKKMKEMKSRDQKEE